MPARGSGGDAGAISNMGRMRRAAMLTGTAMLGIGALLFLYALYLTVASAVVGVVGRATIFSLATAGVAAAAGGLTVATRGRAERSWPLYGAAIVLHLAWYTLALALAD